MFIPLGVIVYMMIAGYTPMYACIYSTIAVVVLSFIRPETRMGFRTFLKALEESAKNTLGVAAACACAGIVIGVINLTGVGLKFTSFVLFIAGDSLIPALILTMLAGIVLGMGMPTTPAYIVQAALLIPALIKLGVEHGRGSHVRFLFLDNFGHHSSCGHGGLCRRGNRRGKTVANRIVGDAHRGHGIHRSFHVCLRHIPALYWHVV